MGTTNLISENPEAAAGAFAIIGGIVSALIIIGLIFSILTIIAGWKIFKKADEPGWKILIPFYNFYIYLKILGLKTWFWFVLALDVLMIVSISIANFDINVLSNGTPEEIELYLNTFDFASNPMLIVSFALNAIYGIILGILSAYRLSKVFGHGIGFAIGNLLLPNIFWLILGFGSSKYNKKNLKS